VASFPRPAGRDRVDGANSYLKRVLQMWQSDASHGELPCCRHICTVKFEQRGHIPAFSVLSGRRQVLRLLFMRTPMGTRRACRHHLRYNHDRDKQGDGHGRVNFGDATWGDRSDHGCHPSCGALQTRTSQESATSLAGHAPYARLVTPQALMQARTKSPTRSGADQARTRI
jgi:hypothetical protein